MSDSLITAVETHFSDPYNRPTDTQVLLDRVREMLARRDLKDPSVPRLRDLERRLLALRSEGCQPPGPLGLRTF
jgi:hypothetical protein